MMFTNLKVVRVLHRMTKVKMILLIGLTLMLGYKEANILRLKVTIWKYCVGIGNMITSIKRRN